MKIASGIGKALVGGFFLLGGLSASAQFGHWHSVLGLHYKIGNPAFPAAAYRNISVTEFRSMVRKAFEASGFSFSSIDEQKNKSTVIQFELSATPKTGLIPKIILSTDEVLDGRKKCNPCFLRYAQVSNAEKIAALPLMMQYDLSTLLVPAIDKAYSNIESSGQKYLDPSFGFNYKPQWKGEQNVIGNSYTEINLPDLGARIFNAYKNAGFTPIESDIDPKAPWIDLTFSFPIDPAKDGGAIYKLRIHSQYDADGRCYPCEVIEQYDPYQRLPPAGLSGVLNRATLESRFSTARSAAFENMKIDLERYLRPRSGFTVPIKPAPLGSPRPPPTPIVVT